ncbi:MAG: 30S ribosomal protein S7, partial [Gammaproteobacteria bacterium]
MPRRREVPKRVILPDPKFHDLQIAKFINMIMRKGKKATAERIMYYALDNVTQKSAMDSVELMEKALENVRPTVEVKSRRVGGSTYQVPTEIRPSRKTALGIRWIIGFARKRSEKGMVNKLAAEFLDASNKRGSAVKKKEDTHK